MTESLKALTVENTSLRAKVENTKDIAQGKSEENEMDATNNTFRDGNSSL